MMENKYHPSDQIAFGNVRRPTKAFFKLIFDTFDLINKIIRRNYLALIIFGITGSLIGFTLYLTSSSNYKVEMLVQHNELTKKTYRDIINNLNVLIESGSAEKLSQELKLSREQTEKVIRVNVVDINDQTLVNDTSTSIIQPFKINAVLTDNSVIDTLQSALLNYLNNNRLTSQLKTTQRQIYEKRLVYIDNQQAKLDSLKENYNRSLLLARPSGTIFNNSFNPAELYIQSDLLEKERELVVKWLNTKSAAIVLIDGFKTPSQPSAWSMKPPVIIGFFAGILCGIFFYILGAIKRHLN
jgi:hypothetical protein